MCIRAKTLPYKVSGGKIEIVRYVKGTSINILDIVEDASQSSLYVV
jgi:hypothetical protein